MSTSIAIPTRSGKQRSSVTSSSTSSSYVSGGIHAGSINGIGNASSNSLDSVVSSSSQSDTSPGNGGNHHVRSGADKGKMPARDMATSWSTPSGSRMERRVSLLSSSISKSEHTVVNIGDPDGPPRLITCVKASQGFDWNQDIFLPSYASDHDYSAELERRQDPVEDIFISDEEAAGMFPR